MLVIANVFQKLSQLSVG